MISNRQEVNRYNLIILLLRQDSRPPWHLQSTGRVSHVGVRQAKPGKGGRMT